MTRIITLLSGLLVVWAVLASGPVEAQNAKPQSEADIAVVVNPKNSINDLKFSMLRKVVLGDEIFWANRLSVVVVLNQPGNSENRRMLRAIAQMTESQFRQHWVAKVFRGEAPSEPINLPSTATVIEFVAQNPGAIAFIPRTDVRQDVKILKVDGMLPGEEGYPIR